MTHEHDGPVGHEHGHEMSEADGQHRDEARRRSAARWLPVAAELVLPYLPPPPATVVDLGCGPAGGVVPALDAGGYRATGIDPDAPDGPAYQPLRLDEARLPAPLDAVVASLSFHHVEDLDAAVATLAEALGRGGTLIALEMDWPALDAAGVEWCFDRLPPAERVRPGGWLATQRAECIAAGRSWSDYRADWAAEHGLHTGARVLEALDSRFDRVELETIPWLFSQLDDSITPEDEMAAVATGALPAAAFRYVGRAR